MIILENIRKEFERSPISTTCQAVGVLLTIIIIVMAISHPKETKGFVQGLIENINLTASKPSDKKIISDATKSLYFGKNPFRPYPAMIVNVSIEGITKQKSEAKVYVNVQYVFTENYLDNYAPPTITYKKGDTIQLKYILNYIKTDRDWIYNGKKDWYPSFSWP